MSEIRYRPCRNCGHMKNVLACESCWPEEISRLTAEIELYVKAQQAKPMICAHIGGGWVWSNCPECGPNVTVDEDGCCRSCGRDAICYGAQEATHV